MSTAVTALLSGMIVAGAAVGLQLQRRRARSRRLSGLELRPNCLLTRYPIAFISGPRTLFRLFDHWNDVPAYLREHGYEVMVIEPGKQASGPDAILSAIATLQSKCHLIADSSQEDLLTGLARSKSRQIASLTLVRNPSRRHSEQKRRPAGATATVEDLKPLDAAIEVFDIGAETKASALDKLLVAILIRAHNLVLWNRPPVDPCETADLNTGAAWELEEKFLDLAVLLAERDAQWSDSP
jgi:hypothetical protein